MRCWRVTSSVSVTCLGSRGGSVGTQLCRQLSLWKALAVLLAWGASGLCFGAEGSSVSRRLRGMLPRGDQREVEAGVSWQGAQRPARCPQGHRLLSRRRSQVQCASSQVPMSNGPSGSSPAKSEVKLELAFEYLMSKDRLQWVTITSPQVGLPVCRARTGSAASGLGVGCREGHRGRGTLTPLLCRPSC